MTAGRAPRVTELGILSIGLVAAGVIYLAAYMPKKAPTGIAVALLAAAVAVFAANVAMLMREQGFAWWRFKIVARWMLLVYLVIAGMIEYAFLYDHTKGTTLVLLTALLAMFTVNVPLIVAFTVARYETG